MSTVAAERFGDPEGSRMTAAMIASTPIGRFTPNTRRQPASSPTSWMMSPPTTGPRAAERPRTAPSTPKALPIERPVNMMRMSAATAGKKIPPAAPCTTRAMMSWRLSWARPQARLATVNRVRPATKTHLCP